MAVGDRPPEGAYRTGATNNGCHYYSDGGLYDANYRRVETNAERMERERKEKAERDAYEAQKQATQRRIDEQNEAMRQAAASFEQTSSEGSVLDSLGGMAMAAGAAFVTAKLVGDYMDDPEQFKKNAKSGSKRVACAIGIVALCVVLFLIQLLYFSFVNDSLGLPLKAVIWLFCAGGYYCIFGLLRVMSDQPFMIGAKKR